MTPTHTSWTLITVTYNSAQTLTRFWSNFAPTPNLTWIVVDNNSSDDSVQIARSLGAQVIESPKNLGFGGANNLGFQKAESDYIAFVNPDVSVDYSSLDALAELIDKTGGLVAPQLLNADGSLQPNGRGWPVLSYKVLNRLKPSLVEGNYRIFAQPGDLLEVPWVIGAALAGNKQTMAQLGPWDERFFVYYEDSDICLRAGKEGIKTYISGDINWVHGWARDTAKVGLNKAFFRSWKLELDSMYKFYSRYPKLIFKAPTHK